MGFINSPNSLNTLNYQFMSHIVIHYSEIGLKGKNRGFFEKKLSDNIKNLVEETDLVWRRYGKIIARVKTDSDLLKVKEKLETIPGISSFAFASKTKLGMEEIKKEAFKVLKNVDFSTFSIKASRSNKSFSKNSTEINIILGDLIRKKLNKKVKLENPNIALHVEICEKEAFLYIQKINGVGGLPVGASGKAVSLLSGGIDSPVASFLAMRRGLKVVYVHVLNKTMTGGREGSQKIKKLVKALTKVQGKSKLYIVPFGEIQKAIIASIPADYRMLVYRRFMVGIAEAVARQEKARAIITGDSVGQVASQTIENLGCVYQKANLPILPPLIGINKEEIIKIAREIKTYELSILPYPDCCSFMIAKHPQTKAKIDRVVYFENLIKNKEELIKRCLLETKIELAKP